jgi:mRNA-degrading endonuclease toxin of MazEF toxin-antitoxin module
MPKLAITSSEPIKRRPTVLVRPPTINPTISHPGR